MIDIVRVTEGRNLEEVRLLFREYATALEIDLSFQNFAEEFANLPATYVPPDGVLLLASNEQEAAGCVAVRRFDTETCEMKRLYVRPQFRGSSVGARLAARAIDEGKKLGYKRMLLDTLSSMLKAQSLYASLGFKEIPAYRYNPEPGTVFMQLDLI